VTFVPGGKINDGPAINWSNVASNLAPNMGDYSNLVADGLNVYANFADGRQGTPDSWVAVINDFATPTLISLVQANAAPDHVELAWFGANDGSVVATVYRRQENTDWRAIADIHADGTGMLTFRDTAIQAGARYEYRIGVSGMDGMQYFGDTWVVVPAAAELAIRQVTSPVTGDLQFNYTLPRNGPATIRLFDVTGRAIASVQVASSGQTSLGGRGLDSGVYWVRLTQGARSVTARTVFIK
jgi:hypothetical protein